MKQAIVVRKDLKMGCGKIAGQVAHASVRAYRAASFWKRRKWFKEGEVKIVLKVRSEDELLEVIYNCFESGVKSASVRDAGRTQIAAGTLTSVGIGPDDDEKIDNIIGGLKLL